MSLRPDDLHGDVSYAYRPVRETPGQVLLNRVTTTAYLFATAIGGAFLLGRRRS